MTTNIYILKLEQNKYYIGKTDNIDKRILQHKNSSGSAWTKKYKYISTENIILNVSPFDEDKYTLEYMEKYGIDNVRGGQYCKVILDDIDLYTINKTILYKDDCCYRCGQKGHFIKDCYNISEEDIELSDSEYDDNNGECYRCGRIGHYYNNCYAKRDINGNNINDDDEEVKDIKKILYNYV